MSIQVEGVGDIAVKNDLSAGELAIVLAGGLLNSVKEKM